MGYPIQKASKCAVIGHGSWATALVKILLENETRVGWYFPKAEDVAYIRQHKTNPRYLRDVHFYTQNLYVSSDLNAVVREADILIFAVPSIYLKQTLGPLTVSVEDKFIVSAIKGIVPDELITVIEYMHRTYRVPSDHTGIITGPCHAEEVALERLSYLTVCCNCLDDARVLGEKIKTPYIQVNASNDIYGAEYAAVLKNIYAIGMGLAVGLGYGDNFLAVFLSNAAMELSRFLESTYPASRNVFASTYLGDLLVTGYSQFSRNRRFGLMVGKGYSVKAAQIEMSMVAEGYYAARCIHEINRTFKVDMPIAQTVYDILYQGSRPKEALMQLTKQLS